MIRPAAVVAAWFLVLAVAAAWNWQAFRIENELGAFLPATEKPVEALLLSRVTEGAASRLILIGFEGGEPRQRIAASRDAVRSLAALEGVKLAENGERRFDLQAFAPLLPFRYLLAPTPDLTVAGLNADLSARLRELSSPLGAWLEGQVASDPTASFRELLLSWADTTGGPLREDGVWVSEDQDRSLVLVEMQSAVDLEATTGIVQAIAKAVRGAAFSHGVTPLIAGHPALASAAQDEIRLTFIINTTLTSALVTGLLLWIYRSIPVLLLGMLPVMGGTAIGLFAVLLVHGHVHGIALALGATLLGVAVDYPLHLFSHHRAGERLAATAAHIQRPMLMSALTTAGAFFMFGFGGVPGLRQLALFAGTGILVAALAVRFVIPALADLTIDLKEPRPLQLLPARAPKASIWIVALAALSAIALLSIRHESVFQEDLAALNPVPQASRQLDGELRAQLGAPDLRYLLLLEAADGEGVLAASEEIEDQLRRLESEGAIKGFDAPHLYLPSVETQQKRQAALPGPNELQQRLETAGAELPFKDGLFKPFLQQIEATKSGEPIKASAGLALFNQTPLGVRLDSLLVPYEGRWYGLLPLSGVAAPDALTSLERSPAAKVIDLRSLSEDLLGRFRAEAVELLAVATVMVALLLALARYPLLTLGRVLAVLLVSIAITAASLILLGERLTMLHMMACLLVMGVGIDYSIFYTWRAANQPAGQKAAFEEQSRTQHALLACLASTVLTFGLLALSSINVLRAVGLTVALGVSTTFFVCYALLTAGKNDMEQR